MKYVDPKGKETEIAYSTEVQERLERTLRESLIWRRKMYYTLNTLKWIAIILIILGGLAVIYLDQRNVLTYFGRKFFCG